MAEFAGEHARMVTPPTPGAREERICIGPPTPVAASGAGRQLVSGRRAMVAAGAAVAGVAACWVLAGVVAASVEESASQPAAGFPSASDYPPTASGVGGLATARRLSAEGPEKAPAVCHTAQPGEPCYRHVAWAMHGGLRTPGQLQKFQHLTANSTFEEFQEALHHDPWASCPRPCSPGGAVAKARMDLEPTVQSLSGAGLGWHPSGRVVARGEWCSGREPSAGWALRGCGNGQQMQLKVLTYNLFWWSLFGRRGGNGGSAGRLIAEAGSQQKFDVMAFQECEGVGWVLGDAGLTGEYAALTGPHALCIAYLRSSWNVLADSSENVAEDQRGDQWYGTRAAMWVRLQHVTTKQVVFFINHHGPLPVQSGGRCGGEATAFNILELIAIQAREGDVVVLTGDFNAGADSETVKQLSTRMHKVTTGNAFGGVDHVLSNCQNVAGTRNLGPGGSDHDAIEAVFQL